MIIDSGWKYFGEFQDCQAVVIDGVNLWEHPHVSTDNTVLMTLPDDPGNLVAFSVTEIRCDGRSARFGMAELHPNHFAFVVPA